MLEYGKAKKLAQTWIDVNSDIELEIIETATVTKPYGWVFFYQSKRYLETGNISDALAGNAPILVEKFNSELRVLGTALTVDEYLSEYEKTIPAIRLD